MLLPTPLPESLIKLLRGAAKSFSGGTSSLRQEWLADPSSLSALLPALLEAESRSALQKESDPLGAYDLAAQGIELAAAIGYPTDELYLVQATALARCGSPLQARALLEKIVAQNNANPRVFGAIARTFRDLARENHDPAKKEQLFRQAADWSQRGMSDSVPNENPEDFIERAYLLGQIAQFAHLGGERERSATTIPKVLQHSDAAESLGVSSDQKFWLETNRAEMALLLGKPEQAAQHYRRMTELAPDQLSHIAANAEVCRLLLGDLGHPPDLLADCFPLPPIVVFSGHIFDTADRPSPRFPVAHAGKDQIIDRRLAQRARHSPGLHLRFRRR